MASSEETITSFFLQLRDGQQSAATPLWNHFFPRLLGLARKTLAGRTHRVADAEDAVQSAFFDFWKQLNRNIPDQGIDRNGLWRLLATITVRKVLKQQERENATKRGGGRVQLASALECDDASANPFEWDVRFCQLPTPEADLVCEELLMQLDEECRAVALLRLMGYRNREVANILERAESTIERKLQLIRRIWDDDCPNR